MKRFVIASFLLVVFCACGQKRIESLVTKNPLPSVAQGTTQDDNGSSQGVAQGPAQGNEYVYYVINSYVVGPQLSTLAPSEKVALRPQTAKVELTAVSEGRYDMDVNYLFAYLPTDKTKSFKIGLKDIPLAEQEDGTLIIQVEGMDGSGTLNAEQFQFEDVTVRGTIGGKEGASLSIAGKVQGKDFSLLMDSFTDKAEEAPSYSADLVIVDYAGYFESSFSNDTGVDCEISFQLTYTPSEKVSIAPTQTYLLSTFAEEELWGGGCNGVSISFADGLVKEYSGIDVARQGEEVAQYMLHKTRGSNWFLYGEADGTIEKRVYTVDTFSIRRPDVQ